MSWSVVFIVPALVIFVINGIWVSILSILLGMISARYRDRPSDIFRDTDILIFWPPEGLGIWMQALPINPLFAAIDVVRAPLLGGAPMAYSWTVLLFVTIVGCIGTFWLFA